jgi:hypothetical protein
MDDDRGRPPRAADVLISLIQALKDVLVAYRAAIIVLVFIALGYLGREQVYRLLELAVSAWGG